jgi:lysozyme
MCAQNAKNAAPRTPGPMPINFDTLRLQMTKHEGYMLTPYLCQANKWSVGIGRNLEDVGISQQEAFAMGKPKWCGRVIRVPLGPATLNGIWVESLSFTPRDVNMLFENDIHARISKFASQPWFGPLSEVRQRVLLDMAFQLGWPGFLKFKNTIAAIKRGDFLTAAKTMLDSLWAKQTPARASRLARMMRMDLDPDWRSVK